LVWFAGIEQNVAFYPRGYHFKKVYTAELVGYKTPKGAIHFPSNAALPTTLITKIVQDRANENRLVAKPLPAGFPEKLSAFRPAGQKNDLQGIKNARQAKVLIS
jgi:hypothetical protein